MIRNLVRGLGPLLISAAMLSPALAQGVPTVDLTSIAKIGEVLTEAKLQVKEMIASNLKLDEQILKQIEQIATLKAQLDALRNGLTLEALGIPDPDTFFDDILPDVADLTGGLISAKDGKYSLMTTSGKVGDKPAAQYVSEFFASAGLDVATVDTLANSEDEGAARIGTQANTAAFLSAAAETSSVKASERGHRPQHPRDGGTVNRARKYLEYGIRPVDGYGRGRRHGCCHRR
jgi:type IV secretion system protein VirB5